jgi:hypothetical protein
MRVLGARGNTCCARMSDPRPRSAMVAPASSPPRGWVGAGAELDRPTEPRCADAHGAATALTRARARHEVAVHTGPPQAHHAREAHFTLGNARSRRATVSVIGNRYRRARGAGSKSNSKPNKGLKKKFARRASKLTRPHTAFPPIKYGHYRACMISPDALHVMPTSSQS